MKIPKTSKKTPPISFIPSPGEKIAEIIVPSSLNKLSIFDLCTNYKIDVKSETPKFVKLRTKPKIPGKIISNP